MIVRIDESGKDQTANLTVVAVSGRDTSSEFPQTTRRMRRSTEFQIGLHRGLCRRKQPPAPARQNGVIVLLISKCPSYFLRTSFLGNIAV